MTGRVVAVVTGLVLLVLAAAAFVRETAQAADQTVSWSFATRVARLTSDPTWLTGVLAAALAVAAVWLIVLAVGQLRAADQRPAVVQFGDDAGWARLEVPALERALARHVASDLPGVRPRTLNLDKEDQLWRAVLTADVPARDLPTLRSRAETLVAADLARTGGMTLELLDLRVRRLLDEPGEGALHNEDLGITRSS